MNKKPASKSKAEVGIPSIEELLNDTKAFPVIDEKGRMQRTHRDVFIRYISETYGVKRAEVVEVLNRSGKDEFYKRQKLAEIAGIMKKEYDMKNYIRNAEMVKKYGREGLTAIVTAAKKSNVHPYHADKVAVWLGLDRVEDVIQMIPYREEAKDLTKLLGENVSSLRAYDQGNRLHIFFYCKSDAEFSAKAEGKSKEEVEKILTLGNIKYKNMFGRFHILNGMLTPNIRDNEDEEQEHAIPVGAKIDAEHLSHGVYKDAQGVSRDDPFANVTGGEEEPGIGEEELDFSHNR